MADADERLLVDAAQRDPSRFADLYERHFERVYAFVISRVRDRDVAEDLTAETFHSAAAPQPKTNAHPRLAAGHLGPPI
jgi:DNA-directed RNA polymerase specialized sigma24 family protein